jgi:hypothetical protein
LRRYGTDVLQSTYSYLYLGGLSAALNTKQQLGMLLAAVVHDVVGGCTLTVSKPALRARTRMFQRMELDYHKLLSTFTFKFNLRRYDVAHPGLNNDFMNKAGGS